MHEFHKVKSNPAAIRNTPHLGLPPARGAEIYARARCQIARRKFIQVCSTHLFITLCGLLTPFRPTMTSKQAVSKRKLHTTDGATRKKLKAQHLSIDDLPWKVVSHTQEAGFDNTLEGMMELEEVDGVEVSYEETDVGKVVRFNVCLAKFPS